MTAGQIVSLMVALREFLGGFRPYFRRRKTFEYLEKYLAGLMADIRRKSVEPIALTAGVPVRTLQEFLSQYVWDDRRIDDAIRRLVADKHASPKALGILDASGHPKQGDKTPGVQHQYCGQRGKQENCVVGQHLLYTDNDGDNPFTCVLDSQLYLPQSWAQDRERCRRAGIPDSLLFRTKWQIGLEQVERAIGNGIRFSHVVFDADYGRTPKFWFGLDAMGQRGVGHVPPDFNAWTTLPHWRSGRAEHASKTVENLANHSPVFTQQDWRELKARELTRGWSRWRMKSARIHLVAEQAPNHHGPSIPTDRQYWLIAAENLRTNERRYFVSNAAAEADPLELLRIGLERWQVEKWFERAKQESGFGAFEVRTYRSLMRHWLCSRLAMLFLSSQTKRLRGEKPRHHGRTSRTRDQQLGLGDLAGIPERPERHHNQMSILPTT